MSFLDCLPKHVRELESVPIDKPLDVLARELNREVIQLGMNENPLGPSPKAVQAMRSCLQDSNRYPDDTGYHLREKLAAHFKVSMEEVIVGVGASELLAIAFAAVLSPDAEVLTSEGSFIVYYLLAAATGMRIVCTPLKNWGIDLDAILSQINPRTRLIIIANPNNPTGTVIGRKQFEAFLEKVPKDILLIVDEAYLDYVENPDYPNSLDYLRSGKTLLTMRTFSKVFGLAGLRIGYAISSRNVIDTLYKVRMSYSLSGLAIAGALAAWDDHEHVEKSVGLNRVEREFLSQEFSKRGMTYIPSSTNFILLDLGARASDVSGKLFQEGVLVRPLASWGLPVGVRVSIGTREQNEKFLKALEKAL